MRTFHTQNVKKSQKRRQCDWCGEAIEIGQPYEAYMWAAYGDAARITMHPECRRAAGELAVKEGGIVEWTTGDFARGSTGEK